MLLFPFLSEEISLHFFYSIRRCFNESLLLLLLLFSDNIYKACYFMSIICQANHLQPSGRFTVISRILFEKKN